MAKNEIKKSDILPELKKIGISNIVDFDDSILYSKIIHEKVCDIMNSDYNEMIENVGNAVINSLGTPNSYLIMNCDDDISLTHPLNKFNISRGEQPNEFIIKGRIINTNMIQVQQTPSEIKIYNRIDELLQNSIENLRVMTCSNTPLSFPTMDIPEVDILLNKLKDCPSVEEMELAQILLSSKCRMIMDDEN